MRNRGHTDLTGNTYNQWTVLHSVRKGPRNRLLWLCTCTCGNEQAIAGDRLKRGDSSKCVQCNIDGNFTKHGAYKTKEYRAYICMRNRVLNSTHRDFKYWGGRGITICPSWLDSFENFIADMGLAPKGNYSLDRRDNEGNYEPGNCRWATTSVQANNKRNGYLHKKPLWLDEAIVLKATGMSSAAIEREVGAYKGQLNRWLKKENLHEYDSVSC